MQVHDFKHVSRGNLQNILAGDLAKCKFSGCLYEKLSTRDTPLYPLSLHHSRAYPSHTATDLLLPHILPKSYLGTFCCPGEVNPEAKAGRSQQEVLRPHLTDLGFASLRMLALCCLLWVQVSLPSQSFTAQTHQGMSRSKKKPVSGHRLPPLVMDFHTFFWFVVFFK